LAKRGERASNTCPGRQTSTIIAGVMRGYATCPHDGQRRAVPESGEIEDARWFSVDALPGIPPQFSIAGHLIRDTVTVLREGLTP
jgi:NADH pyrophosphatase NudC (nudix superfamily)